MGLPRVYGKVGNGNEMETGNGNWKRKLEMETGNLIVHGNYTPGNSTDCV